VQKQRQAVRPVADLETFERELHELFAAAEAEMMGDALARFDIDAPEILVDGVRHLRVLRCSQTYLTASGPVSVERSLYSTRHDGERAVCAMELRAGIGRHLGRGLRPSRPPGRWRI
jgi:hypothetical protein